MIENQWYAIAPEKMVPPGKMSGLKRLGKELLIFQTTNGNWGCLEDLCSHRGVKLSAGKLKEDGCVECPFHGLRFSTTGDCKLIPANGKNTLVDDRYNVRSYAIQVKHGIIYVFNGDKNLATSEVPFFSDFLDESFVYSEIADTWDTHYSRAIENQLDVVHLPFVHHNTIGRGNKTLVHGPKTVVIEDTIITSADNEVDQGQRQRKPQECEINPDLQLRFKYPNIWINIIAKKIKVFVYFAPIDDEQVILYLRFYNCITPFRSVNRLIGFF
ncbi:MAG: aromatic ring-hydroxylating dioxygenase subunit alpha, partial [Erysipelotrichaceae bacterium]|nr:aromatic ring-hydroxylating dioxygenase subunit alpha [Erysipelotrichaceae bacterium]